MTTELEAGDLDDRPGRPDSVSASVSARLSGVAVEDLSQRTEDTRFFALPDGTWNSETTSGPAQVQDGERGADGAGGWNRIDATLEKSGNGWSPKHAAVEVKFSGGDTEWFAKVTRDGHTLDYSFDGALAGKLPTPTVDEDTAVYRNVFAGVVEDVDLVMKTSGTGFSHWLVLTTAPSAEELKALGAATGDDVSFPVRVQDSNTKSPALVEVGEVGNIAITDAAGKKLITASAPLAWDAQTMGPEDFDPAAVALAERGDTSLAKSRKPEGAKGAEQPKAKVVAINTDVEQPKDKAKRAKQGSQVSLSVEKAFLTDATTAYPVTVDPTMTIYTGDTWVQTPTYPSSQASSAELKVGTYNGGVDKARSFMNFRTTAWDGKHIESATLVMRNFYSGSCASGKIRVNRLAEAWDSSTLTWANQPSAVVENSADNETARGYNSSCAEGDVEWNVTDIVQKWVHENKSRYGLRLKAVDETSNNTWRRYRSGNYSANSNHRPHIRVTYNSYPNTAGTPSVEGMNSSGYVKLSKPKIKAVVSDPDGELKADVQVLQGSTVKWSGTTAKVASGTAASITTGDLPDGTYTIRAKGNDGKLPSKSWSPSRTMIIDTTAPNVSISSSSYSPGQWRDTTPSSNAFTFTSTSPDIAAFRIWTNGGNAIVLSPNSNRQATYIWNPGQGGHQVSYQAIDKAGHESAIDSFLFGSGTPSMKVPAEGTVPRVSGNVQVHASGPGSNVGTTTAKVKWRLAGETGDWTEAPGNATVTQSGGTALAKYTLDVRGIAAGTANARLPLLVDLQVCFSYSNFAGQSPKCTPAGSRQIKRIPHAFGDGFPTTEVQGGQVALWTGEFMSSTTDAMLDAGTTSLSISRTHNSFGGPHSSVAGNVFGPGWVTELNGSEAGIEHLELLDSTRQDGTLKLLGSDGTVLMFAPKNAVTSGTLVRRTVADLNVGEWWALDEETAETGLTAVVTGTGTSTTVKFTDEEGVVTTFAAFAAATTSGNAVFMPTAVEEPGNPGETKFEYSGGRVSKIGAPAPTGVTCPPLSSTGTLPAGCRVLEITYASTTTATSTTPGDQKDQVKSITARNGGGDPKVLATYKYNSSKQLVEVTDPRTNLTTKYTYGAGTNSDWYQVASVTPPGLATVKYAYSNDTEKRLLQVNRDRVDGDIAKSSDPVARLNTIVYGLPAKGQEATNLGLPSMDANRTEAWHSHVEEMPEAAGAIAVFGADRRPDATPTAADFKYANLHYTDAKGFDVYGAEYAAGDWRYTATQYDTSNANVVRSLSVQDTQAIATGVATASMVGTLTVYNEVLHNKVDGTVTPLPEGDPNGIIMTAGSVVTDVYAPARAADAEGSSWMRVHTRNVYDEGAPNSKINPATKRRYAVVTSTYTTLADSDATGVQVGSAGNPDAGTPAGETLTSLTRNGYDAPATVTNITASGHAGAVADVADEAKRWELGLPASTTTVMGSSPDASKDITTRTAYDSKGRVIATVQPNAVAANPGIYIPAHAGTRLTTYYKGGSANQENCVDNVQADFLCKTTYAGKAAGSQDLVTSQVWMRDFYGQPLMTVDTGAGTSWRLNSTEYDAAGRVTKKSVYADLPNSRAVPSTTYEYSSTTGLETKVTPSSGSPIERTYDGWGRERTYTTSTNGGAGGAADRTTTTYDAAGRVNTVVDSSTANGGSVLTYTYNSTTSGADDYRGLPTKITATNPNGRAVEINGTYDALGNLVTQSMPGGVVQNSTYDVAGELIEVNYDIGGWKSLMAWSQRHDALGRVIAENTPGTMGVEGEYMREYDYDQAARLTQVVDRLSYWGTTECATRGYTFDRNGNRTEKTSASCVDGSSSTTQAWSYDDADRLTGTTGAPYQYDGLGRVVSVPGVDTPKAGHSGAGLTLAYYDDDSVHTIQQGNGDTTTIALDAAGRRSINTTSGSTSKTETRHYTDGSDNPGWSSTTQAGVTTTERYIPGLNGDLAAVINGGGTGNGIVQVALTTPHGDVAVQVTLPSSGDANWIDGWHPTDEYGNQLNAFSVLAGDTATNNQSSVPGGIGYGWLGAKERAMDHSGLVLMGARLYNPTTGAFTSVDPVFGGNTTAYAYPQDPINQFDLDGQKKCGKMCKLRKGVNKWLTKHYDTVATVGAVSVCLSGIATVGCAGAALIGFSARTLKAARSTKKRDRNFAKRIFADALLSTVSLGAGGAVSHSLKAIAKTSGVRRAKWHSRLANSPYVGVDAIQLGGTARERKWFD